MTPTRFRDCLATLRWTQRGVAEVLACDDRMVRRWAAGHAPVPESIARWLETLATVHDATPIPQDWRQRAVAA